MKMPKKKSKENILNKCDEYDNGRRDSNIHKFGFSIFYSNVTILSPKLVSTMKLNTTLLSKIQSFF